MRICKELKLFSKEFFIDIIVISIIGTIFHFLYEFSGRNLLVAIFSAVNESVWEHIKIAVIPTYIVAIVKMWIMEERKCNLWTSLFFKVLTLILLIPTLFYGYQLIFKSENLVLDIIIFYISIIISEVIEYIVQNKFSISAKVEDVFKYINILNICLFVLFTFKPPRLEIFRDKLENKFGI
jgi:hypothetical protein